MRDAILESPLMAANNLNWRFEGTYGFSVVFTRPALPRIREEFPAFGPYLDAAVQRDCNAFFLNPLLVADGGQVQPHVDYSLHSYCEGLPLPRVVSVLYLNVPPSLEGGRLRLFRDDRPLADLPPREGALVIFRGDLRHAVSPVLRGAPNILAPRLSLVMEQYRVPRRLLARLPEFHVGTRREPGTAPREPFTDPGDGSFADLVRLNLDR